MVKEIWTEEDEGGKVRFATVQVKGLYGFFGLYGLYGLYGSNNDV